MLKMVRMRRLVHVKGDVVCTMLLLLLFCLLLYARQVALSSGWDKPVLKLEVHGSTSSSRTLLEADKESPQASPHLPACKPESKPKAKRRQKNATPTKTSRRLPPPPTLPLFDFDSYLRNKDNRDFRLLLDQPHKCRRDDADDAPFLLVAVKSVAADFDKRQVVRRTWGKEGTFQNGVTIRTVFLLGVPRNRSSLPLWDRLLSYESETFGDVLLWDFDDTFFNLTLKETNFLNWINSSCSNVKFIFKGDADVFVNIENILEMLKGQRSDEDLFVGDIIINPKPIRRRSSKYYVPESVYGAMLYPNYAGGGGFVMSGHTARRLSGACRQVELFPIDDVFLGMCLQLIGVKPTRHQGFRTFGIPRPSAAPHLQTFDPCFYKDLMVVHGLGVPQIWLMWKLLHDPKLSCHGRGGGVTATTWRFAWRGKTETNTETDYGDKQVFITH